MNPIVPEPNILIVGRIAPIMAILRDELRSNYGRCVSSCASRNEVSDFLDSEAFDLVLLGAGFDDETRDHLAEMIAEMAPDVQVTKVPRVGEKSPAKLIDVVNRLAIEWKFGQLLGSGKPGGPAGPGGESGSTDGPSRPTT